MDQFVTTYRKDFLWPYVRIFGLKPDNGPQFGNADEELCRCQCRHEAGDAGGKMIAPNVFEQDSYQKSGPNAPLMDPKLYPAKVGPSPESETHRFNQPNVFLEKLRTKYPFLYEVLRAASPADIITRINRERLRTTYQVDFCHLNEYPSAPYDELIRASGVSGMASCSEPVRLPGDPCRHKQKPQGFKPGPKKGESFSSEKRCGGQGGASGSMSAGGGGPGSGAITVGTTEYQDAISKLGELIIRDKIHYRKKK